MGDRPFQAVFPLVQFYCSTARFLPSWLRYFTHGVRYEVAVDIVTAVYKRRFTIYSNIAILSVSINVFRM